MEVVKAFNANNLHTNIVIKGTHEEPLFRASDIGEVLEMGNVRTSIQNFNETERCDVHTMDIIGRPQTVTFLTEKGLYKLLFKSRKPIAETFQNWVCEVVKEIRLTGTYNLQQQLQETRHQLQETETTFNTRLQNEKQLERQQFLLREFAANCDIVYIIRVKQYENNEYVIKIGESRRGIQNRLNEHKRNYEDILLLDCFSVKRCEEFEKFLHNHPQIKPHKVTALPNHEKEIELFLIGRGLTYETLLGIVRANLHSFNDYNQKYIEDLQRENETFKELIANALAQHEPKNVVLPTSVLNIEDSIKTLIKSQKQIMDKLNILEQRVNAPQQIRTTTNFQEPLPTLGPRLQKIHPETFQLVKVYESVAECLKEYNFRIKRPSIQKAVTENTIYHGYRWMYVERDQDASVITNILPTKQIRSQNTGYIAKLNKEKNEIVNVYLDRKTASLQNGHTSPSALDHAVKHFTISNGFYYKLYDLCDDCLKDAYIEKHGEPILYKDGIGQYNASTNELVREFVCKYDIIKQMKMSDKTLAKALTTKSAYGGFSYRSLGTKLVHGLV
jgi:prophage antirepressor-like protein